MLQEGWTQKKNGSILNPPLKNNLTSIAKKLNENGIEVSVHDQDDEPDGFGFDSLSLQFNKKFTGNMRRFIEKDTIKLNPNMQIGGC